jgi:hypothetical protein
LHDTSFSAVTARTTPSTPSSTAQSFTHAPRLHSCKASSRACLSWSGASSPLPSSFPVLLLHPASQPNSLSSDIDRATSNETLAGGADLDDALKSFFPALTNATLAAYDNVQYPLSKFDNVSQQIRVGTGESTVRCAVRAISPFSLALHLSFSLTRVSGRLDASLRFWIGDAASWSESTYEWTG